MQSKFLWAGVAVVLSLFISSQVFAQSEVIETRQKLMKSNGAAAKAMKKAIEEKDYATVELKAKDIAGNMDKVVDLFPKGSTSDKSKALPVIWEKWDEFSKNPGKVKTAAEDLAKAAAAKDDAAVGAKFKVLGSACANCHKTFRAEDKKSGK